MCLLICITQRLSSSSLHSLSSRPGALNSLAGVVSTLASIYGATQTITFNAWTRKTIIVTGGLTVVCGFLVLIYYIAIRKLQEEHDKKYGKRLAGWRGKGLHHEDG